MVFWYLLNRTQLLHGGSAWNLPMIGPVREREHFVDKLALSRSIRRRIWATRASPRSARPQRHEDPWAGNTSPRASASPCGYEKGNLRRHSPRRRPRRIMKRRAMSSQAEPNYISKARSWTWNRATLGSCRKALATATRSGSVHCAGGHHPARGSARPGQKRASRLNHAIPSRDCDSPFRLAPCFNALAPNFPSSPTSRILNSAVGAVIRQYRLNPRCRKGAAQVLVRESFRAGCRRGASEDVDLNELLVDEGLKRGA